MAQVYLHPQLETMSSDQYPFFFYGTLMRGQENYTLLRWRTVYEQPARAPSMMLYNFKQYPIMTFGDDYVYGELMILQPRSYHELMKEMDYLEGFDENNPAACDLRRFLIPVELESGNQVLAWTYMCSPKDVEKYDFRQTIDHGDWAYFKKRNLIELRFGRYDENVHGKPANETWTINHDTEEQDLPMPQSSIFQWRDGEGHLILLGHGDFDDLLTSDMVGEALNRTRAEGPLAYIWAAGDVDAAEENLLKLADMGSRTGYLVDVVDEDKATLRERLEEAGIILIGDGQDIERLRGGMEGGVMRSLQRAYDKGTTIVGIGNGAAIFGQWMLDHEHKVRPSFSWLKRAIITVEDADIEAMHEFLRNYPNAYGLGIKAGAGTAFSPDGSLDVLGNQQITVALGKNLVEGE